MPPLVVHTPIPAVTQQSCEALLQVAEPHFIDEVGPVSAGVIVSAGGVPVSLGVDVSTVLSAGGAVSELDVSVPSLSVGVTLVSSSWFAVAPPSSPQPMTANVTNNQAATGRERLPP
jgi:hypothetical protein